MCVSVCDMRNLVLLLVCLACALTATGQKATFKDYKVFQLLPKTEEQLEMVQRLEEQSDAYSLWKEARKANSSVDVMVSPHKLAEFTETMDAAGVPYRTLIDDVQKLIDEENAPASTVERSGNGFAFDRYHTLEEIYAYLDNLAKIHPKEVTVVVGGKTFEGRQIKGVKVSFGAGKRGIFIEGGIHAREWISPATVLYILDQLLNSKDPQVRALAEGHDWYIFPSFNPDGYVYTHTKNRLWRKTRTPYTRLCYGTDPNRNWGYKWNSGGASSNPCAETYAGTSPFSDVETRTMSEYIKSISNKFDAYIAFHSYSQLLLFPYGHTKDHLENYDELLAVGKKSIAALARRYGTQYVTGNIAETIYIATGSTVDWVKGVLRKRYAYTYELRDRGRYGFVLPANQIIPTGQETLDSLVAMFKEVNARG